MKNLNCLISQVDHYTIIVIELKVAIVLLGLKMKRWFYFQEMMMTLYSILVIQTTLISLPPLMSNLGNYLNIREYRIWKLMNFLAKGDLALHHPLIVKMIRVLKMLTI